MKLSQLLELINQSESIQKFAEENLLKIAISDDSRYILNYSEQTLGTPKSWISHYCRALTLTGVSKNYKIVSKSFDRFYNVGEKPEYLKDLHDINFDEPFDVQFKYDGSIINVYKHNDKVEIQTRGSFANSDISSIHPGLTWKKLFEQAQKTNLSDTLDELEDITYIYELCSPHNQVVEYYDQPFAKVIGAINIDGTELKNVYEGETYQCNSFEDVEKLLETLKPTQEGFVIAQWDEESQQYKRKKLKTKTWCELSHVKEAGLSSVSKLWNCVLGGDKDEVSSVFPYLKPKLDEMWDEYQNCIQEVTNLYNALKNIENQKDFAMAIKDSDYKGILFAVRSGKSTIISAVQKYLTR